MTIAKRIGGAADPRSILLGAMLFICLFGLGQSDIGVDVTPAVPASSEQSAELTALLRRQERAVFDSMTAGDLSDFPTIFYNDPSIPLPEGLKSAITRVGPEKINTTMAQLAPGPIGGRIGFLSAQVAVGIERQHELAGTLAGNSESPTPASAAGWIDVPFDVFDASILGDHATAKLAYGNREQSEVIDQFTFTQVDGRWYISGVKTMTNSYLQGRKPSIEGRAGPT